MNVKTYGLAPVPAPPTLPLRPIPARSPAALLGWALLLAAPACDGIDAADAGHDDADDADDDDAVDAVDELAELPDPSAAAPAIIIDSNNASNDPNTAKLTASASWLASTSNPGYYGTSYLYANTGPVSDAAEFAFNMPAPGPRFVDVWYTAGTNRSTTAPFIAFDAKGTKLATYSVDQTANGGKWVQLGTVNFTAGWNKVVLSRWTTAGKVVIADAVRIRDVAPPMPWTAIAALDQGIREDSYGLGSFRAPRSGYQHSGIDYLMPVGTALRSPCDGAYLAGYDGGYGNWAQVVCQVPASLAGGTTVYASLLFAHLDKLAVPVTGSDPKAAGAVKRGQSLGSSGKTGNAAAAGIRAHLHFEAALHPSQLAALSEAHISGSDADTPAAAALRTAMAKTCLTPTGLKSLHTSLSLGRRIDPFMLLSCLVGDKPALKTPPNQTLWPWSAEYKATTFDVNVGQVAP